MSKFIRKNWKKGASERFMQGTATAVAAPVTMYALNNIVKPDNKARPYLGIAGVAVHMLSEIFVENELALAAARGIGAASAIDVTGQLILKDSKAKFGLAGTDGIGNADTGNKGDEFDWQAYAAEAAKEAEALKGYDTSYTEVVDKEETAFAGVAEENALTALVG